MFFLADLAIHILGRLHLVVHFVYFGYFSSSSDAFVIGAANVLVGFDDLHLFGRVTIALHVQPSARLQ